MVYLKGELLVEDGVEGLPVDLGLKLLFLVWQQVNLHVRVRCPPHVHRRQLCSLDDPHYELKQTHHHNHNNIPTKRCIKVWLEGLTWHISYTNMKLDYKDCMYTHIHTHDEFKFHFLLM